MIIKHKGTGAILFDGDPSDMIGVNMRGADLSGLYLSGAYMLGADMRGADLSGADLSGVYLRGADLSGATGILCLPVGDPRGYRPVAIIHGDHWIIFAGCRKFTIAESREHWGKKYTGDRETGDQYLAAMDWLEKQPKGGG